MKTMIHSQKMYSAATVAILIGLSAGCEVDKQPTVTATSAERTNLIRLAEQDDPKAQFELALLYDEGQPENNIEALKWYAKAAANGMENAAFNAAVIYDEGEPGVLENNKEAIKWYKMAAEMGSGSAAYNLAIMYGTGEGVRPSEAESMKWMRLAADLGDEQAIEILKNL